MIRFAALEILLFLAPFAVWAILMVVRGGRASLADYRTEAPLIGLAIVGLLLGIAMLLGLVAFGGDTRDRVYVPDRLENGRLIPGRFE
jgi:hypothetical protein